MEKGYFFFEELSMKWQLWSTSFFSPSPLFELQFLSVEVASLLQHQMGKQRWKLVTVALGGDLESVSVWQYRWSLQPMTSTLPFSNFLICKKNILGSDFSLSPLSLTSAPKSVSSLMILIFLYPVHLVMSVTPSPANAIFPSLMSTFWNLWPRTGNLTRPVLSYNAMLFLHFLTPNICSAPSSVALS